MDTTSNKRGKSPTIQTFEVGQQRSTFFLVQNSSFRGQNHQISHDIPKLDQDVEVKTMVSFMFFSPCQSMIEQRKHPGPKH